MKLSLPVRIFTVHLVFMVLLGALGFWVIRDQFNRYEERWTAGVASISTEKLFGPLASEVARSLLAKLESSGPEPGEAYRTNVRGAMDALLVSLPSIERLIIVDPDNRVQYIHGAPTSDLGLRDDYAELLETAEPLRRALTMRSGDAVTEVVIPVVDGARRLGTVVVHYGGESSGASPVDEIALGVATSLLGGTIDDEAYRRSISAGLATVIDSFPLESLLIVDEQSRIQFVSDPEQLDLTFTGERAAQLATDEPLRIPVEGQPGFTDVILPVINPVIEEGAAVGTRKLGAVIIRYRTDADLSLRVPEATAPPVPSALYVQPLVIFLAAVVGGGILLAALTGVPIRRLEKAFEDFRARGYKGPLDVPSEFAEAAKAVHEMGGRLEALDAKGHERVSLLATLSQSLEDGMVAVDPDGVPIAWNPAALRILLATEDDVETVDSPTHEETLAVEEALRRNPDLQFAVERVAIDRPRELSIVRPDTSLAVARVTQVPVELSPGETGTLLLIRDLGTLRKVESHLLEAGRFAVLAHLAAGLAHEIRNPLHAIRINASVVEQYVDLSGADKVSRAVSDSLSTIRDETVRLTDLLNNYLGMVRPGDDAGPVDVRDLCRRVIQLIGYAANRSNVDVLLEGDEVIPFVHGTPSRLQQAILNLVLNAIQAMPDGGTLTITINALHDVVRITVADTGPGLSQELADQLFDTRVTTKPGGSGLGLPLVRLIAESHGGGVWYRSNPGEGAAFTLVLPAPESVAKTASYF